PPGERLPQATPRPADRDCGSAITGQPAAVATTHAASTHALGGSPITMSVLEPSWTVDPVSMPTDRMVLLAEVHGPPSPRPSSESTQVMSPSGTSGSRN